MDEEHCVLATLTLEFAKFSMPQTNAVTTSFLYVLSPSLGFGQDKIPPRLWSKRRCKIT